MTILTLSGFCGLAVRSSSSVDPVIASQTWPSGPFTSWKKLTIKKKQMQEGRKDGFQTAKRKKSRSLTFFALWVLCVTAAKILLSLTKMPTHLVIVFYFSSSLHLRLDCAVSLLSLLHVFFLTARLSVLASTDLSRVLGLNVWLFLPESHS